MNIVQSFPKLAKVKIFDDDDGYHIKASDTDEILDIRFNTPRQALQHAIAEYWVIDQEDY